MSALLGKRFPKTLHEYLMREYDLPPDNLPCQLDKFVEILDTVFGVPASSTIGWAIARNFYSKIGLRFVENENFRLQDYLEQAKKIVLIYDQK